MTLSRPKHRNRTRPRLVAPAIALVLIVSGCGVLNGDDELTSDQAPTDATADASGNAESSDVDASGDSSGDDGNEQANFEDNSTTSVTAAETTTSETTPSTAPISPDPQFCTASKRNNFDIRFAPGESASTVNSTVPADETDLYRIEVGDAQTMSVTVRSAKDDALASITAPDQSIIPGRFVERVVAPTQAGTYLICVAPSVGDVEYELTVSVINDNTPTKVDAPWCGDSVNDRGDIRFQAGAFSGQVQDAVIRGERDLYRLEAGEGQPIDIFLTSLEDNAVFSFRSPSGEIIIDEVSDFRFPLPESGIYTFCIGATRGNASYTMDVTVG